MGKWGTGKVQKTCKECKIFFVGRRDRPSVFCSRNCADKGRFHFNHLIEKKCLVCGNIYKIKKYRKLISFYCSIECRRQRMPAKERHPNWKGGISQRPFKARKVINDLLKEIKSCQECGRKNNLQGHHIFSYSKHPDLIDKKENIIILCIRCHAKKHPEFSNFILKGNFND